MAAVPAASQLPAIRSAWTPETVLLYRAKVRAPARTMAAKVGRKKTLADRDGRQPLRDLIERGFALQISERDEERRETYDAPQDPGAPRGEKSQQAPSIRKLGAIGRDRDDQQLRGENNRQYEQAEEQAKSLEAERKRGCLIGLRRRRPLVLGKVRSR